MTIGRRFAAPARIYRLAAVPACLLGVAAASLVAGCGSSGKGLIPASYAGPLQSDFETVRQAAEAGNGSCSATEAALGKTEEDFRALPRSVDAGLRGNLRQGIANLRVRAHELCLQPLVQTTAGTSTPKTTPTTTPQTTSTPTSSTTTTTPSNTTTTPPPSEGPGGGTEAPEHSETPSGSGGGTGAGEEGGGEGK